jgi:hypothetical protein
MSAMINGNAITIPQDPAGGVSVDSDSAPRITISLPTATKADDLAIVSSGAVAFDNNDGSITVPVIKDDGTLAINTLITGADSPTRYTYRLTIPGGARLALTPDGGAQVKGEDGVSLAIFEPAWARDSTGAPVPSRFIVDGATLTQIVDHDADGVSYPVVADPWWRPAYISHVSWFRRPQGWTLGVVPTKFGRVTSFAARGSAWREVQVKARSALNRSMYLQFVCHADWAPPWRPSWNLDTWRRDVGYWSTVRARCNP